MKDSKPIRKVRVGIVVSDRMDKTVTIKTETRKRHPVYKKFVRRYTKIKAHDEKNEASVGDLVRIVETRPISRNKCWRVVQILEKA